MAFDSNAYKAEFNKQSYDKVTIYFPKGRKDELKVLAKQEGMSMGDLFKDAMFKTYGLDLSK